MKISAGIMKFPFWKIYVIQIIKIINFCEMDITKKGNNQHI